ncbi:bifunctional tRNA (adenosine(37)-N6)-threonylcarbamoyltransferase complex ATPase subunit type 1 TsaE/phosphotransferase [Phyllobacterium sp. YR531]|uniref:bifunctional tRNA (adenosine(37)-N6)-threonylcarbamoyltransferase complex ATPase subunit type 1 TsaE/phosphotransferase n=1 Tax=Phyllobacterium sp. YR531 TaxID=1144343 RepID=UPI00026FCC96|nr:bifunctional tRNA (adenosine(37)-N6)-threonylcarbamoyltransferase complex ATPase subunit type 1 TsaE/phosphotransferase [Phyllobacterium sp. YR531]EJM99927.1 ATPase, YjeE family [Phyllobacterium sp. YR531]
MTSLVVDLPTADDTARLGQDVGLCLRKGDLVTLNGDLGAGKSTFARGLIRTIADDADYDVPSPTFTIVQSYPELRLPVSHVDLYRLSAADEIDELGLDEALLDGAVLVEWPERAQGFLPPVSVNITLRDQGAGRKATIEGQAEFIARLERSMLIRSFLIKAGLPHAERRYLLGDASARGYETISTGSETPLILMNSPYNPGGPILRDGKTYMQIAHLSQSVNAFVALDRLLESKGFRVPKIHAEDLPHGFLLIENLGSEGILDEAGAPVPERYEATVRVLAKLHQVQWPHTTSVTVGSTHRIHDFDLDAMMIEVELLSDWYVPRKNKAPLSPDLKSSYTSAWSNVFSQLNDVECSLLLRDVHSPNILWQAGSVGLDSVGLIDFQDAMIGPAAYDVASLVMDARVTIEPGLQDFLLAAYIDERRAGTVAFDEANFKKAFAIMAAQRNAKILGIFVRLDERDGKPFYLKHLPRIQTYLERAMGHPALAPVKDWCDKHGILAGRIDA